MKRPSVIAICGYARAGKDTLADEIQYLLRIRHSGAKKASFADPLKDAATLAMRQLGLPDVDFHKDEYKVKYRSVLVALGESARAENPDIFADLLAARARTEMDANQSTLLVPDWRYGNEKRVLKHAFGNRAVFCYISREGMMAANQTEHNSIRSIRDDEYAFDFVGHFRDGDILGIRGLAARIVNSLPDL